MQEYHKIQTVYLRDPATKMKTLLEGQFATPEMEYLANARWDWTEKVDGTNIRVHCDGERVTYGGRTDNAQIPAPLVDRLRHLFDDNASLKTLGTDVTLYGEGFGKGIQKAGEQYNPDGVDFILFDVLIGGWWLRRSDVVDIAAKLGIGVAPVVGQGSLFNAVTMAREGFCSHVAATGAPAEGLVIRPAVDLLDRSGKRIIAKIKHKDFQR